MACVLSLTLALTLVLGHSYTQEAYLLRHPGGNSFLDSFMLHATSAILYHAFAAYVILPGSRRLLST